MLAFFYPRMLEGRVLEGSLSPVAHAPVAAAPAGTAHQRRRVHGRTAGKQVYEELRDSIVALRREPGQQLSESELASELGVSRTPVREALIHLAEDRLVEIYPQLGTFVSRVSAHDVREAQFVREALELASLRVALKKAPDDEIAALRRNLQAQRGAHGDGDLELFFSLDERFHQDLTLLSGHRSLWRVVQREKLQLDRVRWLTLPVPSVVADLIGEHEAIQRALAERRRSEAEQLLTRHLRLILEDLPVLERERPELFLQATDGDGGARAPVGSTRGATS